MERWAIFIDIEGFSKIYPHNSLNALKPLRTLMEGIYHIGTKVCPETPNRLFAHQIGDGFVIVSEFSQRSPELPIAIAVVLMRQIVMSGGIAKSSIAQGDFGDIKGCYPDVIRDNSDGSETIRIGNGLMKIFPVMGTALINAHRLSKQERGSLILIDSDLLRNLTNKTIITKNNNEYKVVDWVHTETPEIDEILSSTGIELSKKSEIEDMVRNYISQNRSSLPETWIQNTFSLNKL